MRDRQARSLEVKVTSNNKINNILILLDSSGSMSLKTQDHIKRIDLIKDILNEIVTKLNKNNINTKILKFNDDIEPYHSKNYECSGSTELFYSLNTHFIKYNNAVPDQILIFTDGEITDIDDYLNGSQFNELKLFIKKHKDKFIMIYYKNDNSYIDELSEIFNPNNFINHENTKYSYNIAFSTYLDKTLSN